MTETRPAVAVVRLAELVRGLPVFQILRAVLSPILAMSLLVAGGVAQSADPVRIPNPPVSTSASISSSAIHLSHGRFQDFSVYKPAPPALSFVLFLSGEEGWNSTADAMARQLVQQGAMVAGIDWRKFKASLEAASDACVFPDGDLENLSHFVQAYFHAPTYLSPMLVGVSDGAAMAYAMLVQAPRDTFAAAMTVGFCPSLKLEKPLCKGPRGHGVDFRPIKSLGNPWLNLQGENDEVCAAGATRNFISQVRGAALATLPKVGHDLASRSDWVPQFRAGYNTLAAYHPTARMSPPPVSLSDLPLVELPAQVPAARPGSVPPDAAPADTFAIIMSGDGGWAGLDQDVAAALNAQGIPVVGLDSLRYYWSARTPNGLAADTDRIIRYYLAHFGKQRVLLIGYSQGADVLPFAVNRLPEASRARVALTAVMGMSEHALFEFHLSSWVSDDRSGPATLPEINRITGTPVLCIYGADESDSLCPRLDPKKFIIVKLKGGHHFDGDYANLARQILAAAR